jgi:catechol 2,3-dioxygenase-like lactoylglutathione lyase family enzyme
MNLNQVSLPSTDVERSADFYRRLGFREIVRNLPSYARFECPVGESTFSLHQVSAVPADIGVIVYFECSDIDGAFKELRARGFSFDSPPTDQEWLWREAYLHDPDGNVICLFRAAENRRHPPWRIPEAQK